MDKNEKMNVLMELFPQLKEEQARNLANNGDDINVLITRVIDNNIECPSVPIKELSVNPQRNPKYTHEYNYPEIFQPYMHIEKCVESLREKAAEYSKRAENNGKLGATHLIKEARSHYLIEADEQREIAKEKNREAAMIILRRALESNGPLDFHGLFVKEALLFLEDYYRYKKFDSLRIVTGRKYNSSKLRPAIEEWFKKKGFYVIDEGPVIYATCLFKKKYS